MEVGARIVNAISVAHPSSQSPILVQIDQFLKESPAAINEKIKKTNSYGTLLHWSCIYKLDEIVKNLLSRKEIDTNIKFSGSVRRKFYMEFDNKTAYEIASLEGNEKIKALFPENSVKHQQATEKPIPLTPNPLPPLINLPLITPQPYQTTPSHDEMMISGTPPISRSSLPRGESLPNVSNMNLEENVKQLQNEVEKLKNQLQQKEEYYRNEIAKKDFEIQDLKTKLSQYESQDIDVPSEGFTSEVDFPALMRLKEGETLKRTKESIIDIYQSILDEKLNLKAISDEPNNNTAQIIASYFKSWERTIEAVTDAEMQYGSDDKYVALNAYTSESPCPSYSLYNILNRDLTEGRNPESLEKWKHYLIHMINALKDLPISRETPLFRGVREDLLSKYPIKYKEGKDITFWAFTSTTVKLEKAKEFAKKKEGFGTIFKLVECLSGRDIKKYSRQEREQEVLFPPCCRFKIRTIEKMSQEKYILITIAQIPGDDPFGLKSQKFKYLDKV